MVERSGERIMTRCNTRQILACSLAGMCTLALVTADGRANSSIFSKTLPSTTWILAGSSMGSGVLVDAQRRLVLTNHHVVAEAAEVIVVFPEFANGHLQADRDYYTRHISEIGISGRVLRSDPDRDLALVELSRLPSHAEQIALGPSAAPGDEVHCVGNPGTSDALWNYTCGKVRSNYYRMFQTSVAHRMQVVETSAPINPGDSGGPIVNNEGQLVAISQSYLVDGRLVSIGVDITEITWFLHKAEGAVSLESPTSGDDCGSRPDDDPTFHLRQAARCRSRLTEATAATYSSPAKCSIIRD